MKKKKIARPTLKDIAAKSGLSVSAVSQILNNKPNFCSEENKEMVRKIAEEMNYLPSFGYKVMHGEDTNTISLICSAPRVKIDAHVKELFLLLMSTLNENGCSVYMATMGPDSQSNQAKVKELINRGSSSFIFIGESFGQEEIEQLLIKHHINYIGYRAKPFSRNISVNPGYAYKKYIDYFKASGIVNFKLICNKTDHLRLSGLFNSFPNEDHHTLMKAYHVDIGPELSSINDYVQAGYTITKELLQADKGIRGLIFQTDYYAMGCCNYLKDNNLIIGEDIHICGFNNIESVQLSNIPISTGDHDVPTLCNQLLDHLFSKEKTVDILLNPKVIIKQHKL